MYFEPRSYVLILRYSTMVQLSVITTFAVCPRLILRFILESFPKPNIQHKFMTNPNPKNAIFMIIVTDHGYRGPSITMSVTITPTSLQPKISISYITTNDIQLQKS